jgi:hypothetical protein
MAKLTILLALVVAAAVVHAETLDRKKVGISMEMTLFSI